MSDQVSKRSNENSEIDENDPLFELAQVVSGDDLKTDSASGKLELVEYNLTEEELQSLTPADLEPQLLSPIDLESELMEGLDLGLEEEPALQTTPEAPQEPTLSEDLQQEPSQSHEMPPMEHQSTEMQYESQVDTLAAETGIDEIQENAPESVNQELAATDIPQSPQVAEETQPINLEDELLQELQVDGPLEETHVTIAATSQPDLSDVSQYLDEPSANPVDLDLDVVVENDTNSQANNTAHSQQQEIDAEIDALLSEDTAVDPALSEPDMNAVQTETSAPEPDPFEQVQALASDAAREVAEEQSMANATPDFEGAFAEDLVGTTELPIDKPFESGDLGQAFMAEFEQLENTPASPTANDDSFEAALEGEFLENFEAELTGTPPELQPAGDQLASAQTNGFVQDSDATDPAAAGIPGAMPMPGNGATQPDYVSDPAMFDDPAFALEPESKGGGFKMAAMAIGVALVAGLSAVGYGYFTNGSVTSDEAPIIAADKTPIKQKPIETAKASDVKKEKASYEKVEGQAESSTQTKLVSGTEKVKKIETSKTEERLAPSTDSTATAAPKSVNLRKVRTVTVKPDGTIVQNDPVVIAPAKTIIAAEPAKELETMANAILPAATTPEAVLPAATTPEDKSIDGAKKSGVIAVPSSSPLSKLEIRKEKEVAFLEPAKPKPVVTKKIQPAKPKPVVKRAPKPKPAEQPIKIASKQVAAPSGGWVVQISSQRSRDAAESSLRNLKRRFPVLNGKSIAVREAQVQGKGTFFRVRVQTASKQAASKFCSQYKSRGGSCFVSK